MAASQTPGGAASGERGAGRRRRRNARSLTTRRPTTRADARRTTQAERPATAAGATVGVAPQESLSPKPARHRASPPTRFTDVSSRSRSTALFADKGRVPSRSPLRSSAEAIPRCMCSAVQRRVSAVKASSDADVSRPARFVGTTSPSQPADRRRDPGQILTRKILELVGSACAAYTADDVARLAKVVHQFDRPSSTADPELAHIHSVTVHQPAHDPSSARHYDAPAWSRARRRTHDLARRPQTASASRRVSRAPLLDDPRRRWSIVSPETFQRHQRRFSRNWRTTLIRSDEA